MKIKQFLRVSAVSVGFSLLVGCSIYGDDPLYDSFSRKGERERFKDDVRSYQIGWLGQALLKPQTRGFVARQLAENAPEISAAGGFTATDAADLSIAAQMFTDVAVGQLGSGLGGNVGSAFFVGGLALSMLAGDGSLKTTSVVLLPEELDGEVLDTPERAKAAAHRLMAERYALAAAQFGYSFECEYSCDALPSLFRMQRQAEADTSSFIYAADDVAVYFADFEIVASDETQAIDSLATGFNVAWRSHFNNDAAINMVLNPRLDEQGKVEIEANDKMVAGWVFYGDRRFFRTDFGKVFLREVYKTPYMFYGTAQSHPKVAYYDGVVYQYVLNDSATAFNRVVLPFEPLVLNEPVE